MEAFLPSPLWRSQYLYDCPLGKSPTYPPARVSDGYHEGMSLGLMSPAGGTRVRAPLVWAPSTTEYLEASQKQLMWLGD